jgi:uncharacterized protein
MSDDKPVPLMRQIVDAIKSGNLTAVGELIRTNPEQLHFKTPFGGQTWLGYAAGNAPLEMVNELLDLGFDVNEGGRDNVKPLCDACYKGRLDVVRLLLDAGSVFDTAVSVQNPLFSAIVGRSPEIVGLLLERGIDATVRYNSKTMTNMDAVAFALMQGETECARIIAQWNAKGDEVAADAALVEGLRIAKENAYMKR